MPAYLPKTRRASSSSSTRSCFNHPHPHHPDIVKDQDDQGRCLVGSAGLDLRQGIGEAACVFISTMSWQAVVVQLGAALMHARSTDYLTSWAPHEPLRACQWISIVIRFFFFFSSSLLFFLCACPPRLLIGLEPPSRPSL